MPIDAGLSRRYIWSAPRTSIGHPQAPGGRTDWSVRHDLREAEYSYARRRAARVVIALDRPRFSKDYARAALWDCEREIQEHAVQTGSEAADSATEKQIARIGRGILSPW